MRSIMVVFSSVTLSKKISDCAIETAKEKDSRLIIVEVKSHRIPREVAKMMGEKGFMGKAVADQLEEEIFRERMDHIERGLKKLEERAHQSGIPTETIILDKPSSNRILEIAKEKNCEIIIAEKRMEDIEVGKSVPFEVIRIKS
jgi:nucleotide-binding universal stress UspA family protein